MNLDLSASSLFLQRLERKLVGLSPADREEIIAELRGHIEEQRVRSGDDGSEAIAALGSPDLLGQALREARRPQLAHRLIAHSIAAARRLAAGARVSLAGLLYVTASAFMAVAVAKPIMPAHVGLWTASHQVVFGIVSAPGAPSTERLGFWLMPLAMLVATMIAGMGVVVAKARGWTRQQAVL